MNPNNGKIKVTYANGSTLDVDGVNMKVRVARAHKTVSYPIKPDEGETALDKKMVLEIDSRFNLQALVSGMFATAITASFGKADYKA